MCVCVRVCTCALVCMCMSVYTYEPVLSQFFSMYPPQERASHIKTFIYVKIPQTSLCITYKVRKGKGPYDM